MTATTSSITSSISSLWVVPVTSPSVGSSSGREYDTSESPQGFSRGTQTLDYRSTDEFRPDDEPTEGDVTGTTHSEDIDEVIDDVVAVIEPQFAKGRSELLYTEIKTAGGRPFMTYLALLFLSNRGEIRLQQDELFGDLWIQDSEAVEAREELAEPEPVAD